MPTEASARRGDDATGLDILLYLLTGGKYAQGMVLLDADTKQVVSVIANALKVNIPLLAGEQTGPGWLSMSLKNRVSTATDFVGTAAAPQIIDGNQTKRFKLGAAPDPDGVGSLGRYEYSHLAIRSANSLGAPSVAMRIFLAWEAGLPWNDSNGETEVPSWQEYKWWKYVMNEPVQHKAGGVKDSSTPASADLVAPVAGVEVGVLAYAMGASAATDAGLETDDAATNFDPEWPIGADGGIVSPTLPRGLHLYRTAAGRGLQMGKSGGQEVAGQVWYQTHPKIWGSTLDKIAIWVPRCEAIGIQFVGTGTPGTDQLRFHVRHVGFH